MKMSKTIALLLLIVCSACSKKEADTQVQTQAESEKSGIADTIKRETVSINSAKKTLDESKQVNQTIMDSADQQHKTIEKTSNGTGQ